MTKLPPLKSLPAFIAAAEHESFTKAAKKLNVTQGAVSKQIDLLENYLHTKLFERKHQSLTIKQEAKRYFESIKQAFAIISEATETITKKNDLNTLTINILPSLSVEWVSPIIKEFSSTYNVNIENGSGYEEIEFGNHVDIAIRIGKTDQKWKGCIIENLIEEKLICVCSTSYKKRKEPIKKPADFLKHKLLNNSSRPFLWNQYLKLIGATENNNKYNGNFEHFFMLIEAAKNGLGIALVPEFMVKDELQNGSLNLAYKTPFDSGYSYQLIYQKHQTNNKKIISFTNWAKEMTKNY